MLSQLRERNDATIADFLIDSPHARTSMVVLVVWIRPTIPPLVSVNWVFESAVQSELNDVKPDVWLSRGHRCC